MTLRDFKVSKWDILLIFGDFRLRRTAANFKNEFLRNGRRYRVSQEMAPFIVRLITSPNINRFSKFFYYQNQEIIRNEHATTDPTTPQMCYYTTL